MANTHRAYIEDHTGRKKMIASGTLLFCTRIADERAVKTGQTCGVTTVDDETVKLG